MLGLLGFVTMLAECVVPCLKILPPFCCPALCPLHTDLRSSTAMPLFTRNILWDVNPETFDIQQGRRLVIQRVLMLGTLDDLRLLKTLYSLSDIQNEVMRIKDWDVKVLNFISLWLDIPREQFACCTHRRSHHKHWD